MTRRLTFVSMPSPAAQIGAEHVLHARRPAAICASRAITQLESTEYTATGIALNPADWEAIALTKTTINDYVVGEPGGAEAGGSNPSTLWNLPVVSTNAMTAEQFLVADFPMSALLFDRM